MSRARSVLLLSVLATMAAMSCPARPAMAATLTWNANGRGAPSDGSGSWSLTGSNWWSGSANQPWRNADHDTAQFGAGSGGSTACTVRLGQAVTVGGIIFQNQAYTLTGGTLMLSAGTITTSAASATIGSVLAGAGGLTKTGTGTLTLLGANTYGGKTAVNAGTLLIGNSHALQNSTLTTGGGGAIAFSSKVASHAFTLGGLSGSGTIAMTDDAGNPVALTIGNNNADATFSGVLTGAGSLTVTGTGTLTITGSITSTPPGPARAH